MAESAQLALSVGDRVVYPKQGVCRVAGIESKEVAGQTLTFVTMRREEDGAVMWVPEGKVQSIGLRKIASQDDVARMFTFLREDADKADLDWKQRKVANLDRMSQGGLKGLAEVVKGLQVLSELRPLPAKERELYDTARHLLVMEISASLAIAECDAEDSVDVALFPPGKDRPKRTAADFKGAGTGEDGEGLDVSDDLLGMGGELDLPGEDAAGEEEASEEGEDAKPVKAKLSDDEVTLTGTALPAFTEGPKKRGRPPKAKTEVPSPLAGLPKKRGRPPKVAAAPPPPPIAEAPPQPPPPRPPPAAAKPPPAAAAKATPPAAKPPPAAAKPPPAAKAAPAAEPKKRGRPPKAAAAKPAGKGAKKK
jgi:CarD family transcriptional regulator